MHDKCLRWPQGVRTAIGKADETAHSCCREAPRVLLLHSTEKLLAVPQPESKCTSRFSQKAETLRPHALVTPTGVYWEAAQKVFQGNICDYTVV